MPALKRLLLLILAAPFLLLAASEALHMLRHGHLFAPLILHWDLESREIELRGQPVHQIRGRLTNYTLAPLELERVEGPGFLWFREARYRHRLESREGDTGPWKIAFREDLSYERQNLPSGPYKLYPWSSIATAYYSVRESAATTGFDAPLLRPGDAVRFTLLTRLDGEEASADQRVYRSPEFLVRGATPDSAKDARRM